MAGSLQQKLDAYFKTGKGVQQLKDIATRISERETARMAEILRSHISAYDFLDHVTTSGTMEVMMMSGSIQLFSGVGYDEGAVHRESWYSEKWGEGVDLFTLFNYGYDAERAVFKREGNSIKFSLTHRDPLHFIQDAINEFNASAPPGVRAILSDGYMEVR